VFIGKTNWKTIESREVVKVRRLYETSCETYYKCPTRGDFAEYDIGYDIALFKLKKKLNWTNTIDIHIAPVCLGIVGIPFTHLRDLIGVRHFGKLHQEAILSGWGLHILQNGRDTLPDVLRFDYTYLNLCSNVNGEQKYADIRGRICTNATRDKLGTGPGCNVCMM